MVFKLAKGWYFIITTMEDLLTRDAYERSIRSLNFQVAQLAKVNKELKKRYAYLIKKNKEYLSEAKIWEDKYTKLKEDKYLKSKEALIQEAVSNAINRVLKDYVTLVYDEYKRCDVPCITPSNFEKFRQALVKLQDESMSDM